MRLWAFSVILLLALSKSQSTCKAGCSVCSTTQATCFICRLSSEQRTADGGCRAVPTLIPSCAVYNLNGSCFQCQPTYNLTDGKCLKDSSGCLARKASDCTECGFGTVLYSGVCRGILNCVSYNSLGNNAYTCQTCADGFINSFGLTCYIVTGCISVLANGGCAECISGFYLSGYSCVSVSIQLPNCAITSVNGKCMHCSEGFELKGESCTLRSDATQSNSTPSLSNAVVLPLPAASATKPISAQSYVPAAPLANKTVGPDLTAGFLAAAMTLPQKPAPVLPLDPPAAGLPVRNGSNTASASNTSAKQTTARTTSTTTVAVSTLQTNGTASPLPASILPLPPSASPQKLTSSTPSPSSLPSLPSPENLTKPPVAPAVQTPANPVAKPTATEGASANNASLRSQSATQLPGPTALPANSSAPKTGVVNILAVPQDSAVLVANCLQMDSSGRRCILCDPATYLTENSTCKAIPANCQNFDLSTSQCQQCIYGYSLNQEQCVAVPNPDPSCQQYVDNRCALCSYRYYLSRNSCLPLNAMCRTATSQGICTACLEPYAVSPAGDCMDASCNLSANYRCSSCRKGYQLNATGNSCSKISIQGCEAANEQGCTQCSSQLLLYSSLCLPIVKNCKQYDLTTKACKLCVAQFELKNASCVPQNCRNWTDHECIGCSDGFYLDQSVCRPSPVQHCKVYFASECQICDDGYSLTGAACQLPTPIGCSNFTNASCWACSSGYTLTNGVCQITPPPAIAPPSAPSGGVLPSTKCVQFASNGSCKSCLASYVLAEGQCKQQTAQQELVLFTNKLSISVVTDPNCLVYNSNATLCLECVSHYYLREWRCTEANPLCLTFNAATGECVSCFPDYRLSQGACLKTANVACATSDPTSSQCLSCYLGYQLTPNGRCLPLSNPNCRRLTEAGCEQCSQGYFLRNGQCQMISNLCASSNSTTGECTSCYQGYQLSKGSCSISSQQSNCRRYENNACAECSQSFYMTADGRCVAQNPQCKSVEALNGSNCVSCYPGYDLVNNTCVMPRNSDRYCDQRAGLLCLHCRNGYWLRDGICTAVDLNCQGYDQATGSCLSCSNEFVLVQGRCLTLPNPNDRNCVKVDAQLNCLSCSDGWFVKDGHCQTISILCLSFDSSIGLCVQCQPGYFLQEGDCIYPAMGYDPYCLHYRSSYCDSCQQGYYLSSFVCFRRDPDCTDFDERTATCKRCSKGVPNGPNCEI